MQHVQQQQDEGVLVLTTASERLRAASTAAALQRIMIAWYGNLRTRFNAFQ